MLRVQYHSLDKLSEMKVAVVLLALVALGATAPQPRKLFHEHFEDFLDVIEEEAGHDLQHLVEHYIEFEEFWVSLNYLMSTDFKDLVYEMESLPEFQAVVEFLENDNIDITYFIDMFNELFDKKRRSRHELSGRDFNAFIQDSIAELPKAQLAALYDQKMSENEEFRVAMENLQSEEWANVFGALWESEVFQVEVQALADHGIDVNVLMDELMAIFGQN